MPRSTIASLMLTGLAGLAGLQAGEPGGVRLVTVDPLVPVGGAKGDPLPDGPLQPLRLVGPLNGTASAQVVVSGGGALSARLGALSTKDGAKLPADACTIRYAALQLPSAKKPSPYCDALLDAPIPDSTVQPIWLTATIPADAKAGTYAGTLTVTVAGKTTPVPVEITACDWKAPSPKDGRSLIGLFPSFEATADRYQVPLWSPQHWKLLEQSLVQLGRTGNDIIHIPLVAGTFVSARQSILTFTQNGSNLVPDVAILDRYLALYTKHVGVPKILVLDVWDSAMVDKRSWKNGKPTLSYVVGKDGSYAAVEGPYFGDPGSEQLWKAVFASVKASLKQAGWDKTVMILGEANDTKPSADLGKFFAGLWPGIAWDVFTHGRGDPWPKRGQMHEFNGIRYFFWEQPAGKAGLNPTTDPVRGYRTIDGTETVETTSTRHNWVQDDARPFMYRALPDVAATGTNMGATRYGLDYWGDEMMFKGWFNLWRNNCRALLAPGPSGPVSTVRFEMLVEGLQELEARIVLEDALTKKTVPEALAKQISELLVERNTIRLAGRPSWPAGPDWQERTKRLFTLAGQATSTP